MTLDKALYPTKVHSTGGWKNIVTRLALIGFALAAVTGAFAYFGGWLGNRTSPTGRTPGVVLGFSSRRATANCGELR